MPAKRAAAKPSDRAPPVDRALEKAHESFRDGNYGGAIAVINQILSRDPENTDALILASQCHSLLGHTDQAVAFDRKAVEAHSDNPALWMTLAFDLANLGDLEAAEEACRKAAELDPTRAAAWYRLACFAARRGDLEEALADLEKACAESEEYREEAKSQPEFAPLREDPRFMRIVEGTKETDDPYAEWMRSKT